MYVETLLPALWIILQFYNYFTSLQVYSFISLQWIKKASLRIDASRFHVQWTVTHIPNGTHLPKCEYAGRHRKNPLNSCVLSELEQIQTNSMLWEKT